MKKLISMFLAAVLCTALFSGCGTPKTENKTLNVLTWDGYIPQTVLDDFRNETNMKINISNFNTNEEMLTKLQSSESSQYDLVIGSDYIIDIARKNNLLAELDKSKIPNYNNIDSVFLNQYYDPEGKYTMPYSAGTPLIVYDPAKVSIEIKGYEDLWNPALKDSIVMMDDARNVLGITLKTMGKSMNETDPQVLQQAGEKLMALKPNIRLLDYNNPQEAVLSGEAAVGYMFTSQVATVLEANPNLKVVYPEEGMGFGIDNWFIPEKAQHKENAQAFLNYMYDPERFAYIADQIKYICVNKESAPYLPEAYKNNKALYIPSDILGDTEFIQDVGTDTTAIFDKIWTQFKQA